MTRPKQKLLDAEDAKWRVLWALLDRLAGGDWLRPGVNGEWTAKDLLAHIAVWHALTTDRLEALRMNGELPPAPDPDTFNKEQYEQCRDLSLHDVRVMAGASRHRFREELDLLPDEPGERLQQIIASNADGHYAEHIPQVDAFLAIR